MASKHFSSIICVKMSADDHHVLHNASCEIRPQFNLPLGGVNRSLDTMLT